MNIKSYGRSNVRKQKEINNSKQKIALDIYLHLYFLEKKELKYLESRYYLVRSGEGLTTSLTIMTRSKSNNKEKSRTSNNDVVPQYFMKLLDEFKDLTHLGYRKKQVKNEPTEAYLFLVKIIISHL